ncbi:trypsin-like peptidase domain-containing protein [Paucibacter sp. APW11]|uniref:Trypsin-like peptidase domain-containing protein n=1 Tax=Roseateles aquae TaxID=3077235 RepID=A0ABU3PFQ2_9BURK|nr:trypsin-like peptidase domain-containing protein [Paucibacter sp. APW11]MDT9001420.1 trypsin-like peptidase domain-containing protein [Paucibacter sp. APW11]
MRKVWLIFAQATTVALAGLFVVQTLKPQWLPVGANTATTAPPRPTATLQTSPGLLAPPSPAERSAPGARPGFSLAAHRAAPAVVSVSANKAARKPRARAEGDEEDEDLWYRFHGGKRPRGDNRPQVGLGSGVIVSAEGYLLTNNHVVEGASDIQVQLSDGREARAELIGTDPDTDLAVLRIQLPELPVISLGEAESLQVGDAVLAIGNPFNVGQTVTSGIVSALGRNQLGINTFENFIQTDAAINPGNSGGALVDAEGKLLGINTAIYSRSGGSMGIGFAIPVSTARQVLEAIVAEGQVSRGWIGVQTREITPEVVEAFKLADRSGVLISGVVQKGPAASSGIKAGDVMLAVAGHAVNNPVQLLAAVAALKPQTRAAVTVQRGKQRLDIELEVGRRPRPVSNPD